MRRLTNRHRRHPFAGGATRWRAVLVAGLIAGGQSAPPVVTATALDDYVATVDPHTGYNAASPLDRSGYTAHRLDLTSQAWRSASEVNRTLWKHWLTIIEPDDLSHTRALLIIGEGYNPVAIPTSFDPKHTEAAQQTESIVAHLTTVPNQPLTFAGESEPRVEDAILAYSFDRYLVTGDDTWPALLPMVKSAVVAMDAIQDYLSGVGVVVTDFVVAGASKRGWTTWLTAAVDPRVVAIVPIVYDNLNIEAQMAHQYATYGHYSEALADYLEFNLPQRLATPEGQALLTIVDPYRYLDRLGLPKYMINSTGDPFFLLDSSQFYFDDLSGPKYVRYIPNTGHVLEGSDYFESVVAFHDAVLTGATLPEISWTFVPGGTIRVETDTSPQEVNLWQATNPSARDFRFDTIGAAWSSSSVSHQGGGVYEGSVTDPGVGYIAFLLELVFDSGGNNPYIFTTEVNVLASPLAADAPLPSETCMGSGSRLQGVPNPFRQRAEFHFATPRDGDVTLDVYDLTGRLVRELTATGQRGVQQFITWDGRDRRGKAVTSGVYFVRLTGAGTTDATCITCVR